MAAAAMAPRPQAGYAGGAMAPLPGRTDQGPAVSGPCRVERFQAVFDPLLDAAMDLHSEAAGKEGVRRGLQSLYYKMGEGELPGAVQEKLLRLLAAVEVRDSSAANKVREEIIRTTTTGWVEGGTWQWALKHLIEAAKDVAPVKVPDADGQKLADADASEEVSDEVATLITTIESRLAEARKSGDARRCDEFAKRLESLFAALRSRFVNANTLSQLLAALKAAEEKDSTAAQKCLQEIAKTDFETSKTWLPALKQLLR
eukprot:TRINITY_DN22275_c0_g1_i3.p1 TRINITY_DN22275_c0_g1~~TRINITY_DN22275_c0_g1_i3.p1  ORF type:complete len:267 (-),score=69.17 TRINITY_DN22275_c0_g1_i3:12-785(-)